MSALTIAGVTAASPLRMLDVRSPWLERRLELPLSEADVAAVRSTGAKLGAYYHWYLQKLVIADAIKQLDREQATRLIAQVDHTDYAGVVDAVRRSDTGVLIAIPHHAHYVLSMTALAARLGKHTTVNVFYGQPATHKGNAVFDHLHEVLFSDPACGVNVIHDTRQGLVKAIKGLKNGEVVVIMPDAAQDEDATLMIPFCGRLMDAMLGTATLARKTGAWILPVLSRIHGRGLGFRTEFGERIDYPIAHAAELDPEQTRIADYGVMRQVFSQFEAVMQDELYLWQNVRKYLTSSPTGGLAPKDELSSLLSAIETDPLFGSPDLVLDLR